MHQVLSKAGRYSKLKLSEEIQQMFGDVALSPTQTKEWFKRLKNGRESVESEPRSGRLCTSRNEEVKDQVREEVLNDRRVTVREITVEVGISTGSVHSILTEDLRMRRVSAKFVPKLLTEKTGASERNLQGHAGLREP